MTNMAYMMEPSYYNNQPTAYNGHERSAYQPWNQYPMNYVYYQMHLPAMNVPSQVPISQVPMYDQFPLVQNQLYTPDGDEPPVAMSTCVPRETPMYCHVPLISKVGPKHAYGT